MSRRSERSRGISGYVPRTVSDWLLLSLGLALLALVFLHRRDIPAAWRNPARWWAAWRDPAEYMESRSPSQPLNVVLGVGLGMAAVIYAVVSLLS